PFKMYEAASEMRWLLPSYLCPLITFIFFSTIYTSSLFLMAVSVDRYLCVAFPVKYKIHQKPIYGVICSIFVWFTTSTHLCFVYIVDHLTGGDNQGHDCYNNFTQPQLDVVLPMRLELCLVLYFLPLIVCTFCYTRFIHILRRTASLNKEKRRRAVGMAMGTLLVFVVCFLPYNITHILGYIFKDNVEWRSDALLLTTVNTVFDPITFYFSSAAFQGNLKTYIITFLIGLPANILAVYAFIRKLCKNPTPTDVLLLNLTLSDLLFLFFLPLKMYEAASGMKWHLSQTLCSIMSFVFFTTIYTSSLLLMAVSIDRYLGVAFPVTYMKFRKLIYAFAGSIFIWLFSGAHCTLVFFVVHIGGENRTEPMTTCYENFTDEQKKIVLPVRLEFFVVLCLVPLIVCVFCYLNCIWILYHRPRITKEKKQRAIGMALSTLSVFLICFMPYNFSHLVGFNTNNSPSWRYYTLLLSTFNTCLDPIIFYFSSNVY
ncbi:free fatty acid receptor 3-like, partial [Silurus asotus]